MRTLQFFLLTLVLSLLSGCDDDDGPTQSLPEATQTGRGIFACYVDGKPFIDNSGSPNGISFNCYYQLINGEYYFGIQGNDRIADLISVGFGTNKLGFVEGQLYTFGSDIENSLFGRCSFNPNTNSQETSDTNSGYTGQLQITKFDLQNQIVSGTFWFDIQNPFTVERVEIREGRFDTHFGL